ncbi:unnamed protein product, partial [Urochloa humidicola]
DPSQSSRPSTRTRTPNPDVLSPTCSVRAHAVTLASPLPLVLSSLLLTVLAHYSPVHGHQLRHTLILS